MKKENGVMDAGELIDSIIHDLNDSVRFALNGQYLPWCGIMSNTAQKLSLLKDGVASDMASKNQTIEDLKNALKAAGAEVQTLTPEEFAEEIKKGTVLCDGGH